MNERQAIEQYWERRAREPHLREGARMIIGTARVLAEAMGWGGSQEAVFNALAVAMREALEPEPS